ncbi:MAG: DinB family protein [Pirellulales bacterium]
MDYTACDYWQGSLWKTFAHMFAAEYVWLATRGDESVFRAMWRKASGESAWRRCHANFEEMQSRWLAHEESWQPYLQSLTVESLEELVYKKISSSTDGKRLGARRGDILLHVCTHAHYTTAQAMNMLRQLGVQKLPDVMLIQLARLEENPA